MDTRSSGGVLSSQQLRALVESELHLVTGFGDIDAQVQPNGFDLRLSEVRRFSRPGRIAIDNASRRLSDLEPVFDVDGMLHLDPGPYHITYAETVNIPDNIMAFGRPRSSLARCGVSIHTAVWDAGYTGRSTSLLVVENPHGFDVEVGARVMQLVFVTLSEETNQRYGGVYQGEST